MNGFNNIQKGKTFTNGKRGNEIIISCDNKQRKLSQKQSS